MIIEGCKSGPKVADAIKAINKHTNISMKEATEIINNVLSGRVIQVPDDFVLREDLEDARFIVR